MWEPRLVVQPLWAALELEAEAAFDIADTSNFRQLDEPHFRLEARLSSNPQIRIELKQHVEIPNQVLF
jgi:hypothetical protein